MACFLVPLAEGVVVTVAKSLIKASNKHRVDDVVKSSRADSILQKVGYLQTMLFGGSALLAIEHIYHGEVVLYPPFLTAINTPEEIPLMLHEMSTVGVGMAILTTAIWGITVGVMELVKKHKVQKPNLQGAKA